MTAAYVVRVGRRDGDDPCGAYVAADEDVWTVMQSRARRFGSRESAATVAAAMPGARVVRLRPRPRLYVVRVGSCSYVTREATGSGCVWGRSTAQRRAYRMDCRAGADLLAHVEGGRVVRLRSRAVPS